VIAVRSTHYPLQVEIHYHEGSIVELQPIVFSAKGSAFAVHGLSEFHYNIFSSQECKYEDLIGRCRCPPCIRPERLPGGRSNPRSSELAISKEEEFYEVSPGTSLTFNLSLRLDSWLGELKPGADYSGAFIGETKGIKYWRYATLEVCIEIPTWPGVHLLREI